MAEESDDAHPVDVPPAEPHPTAAATAHGPTGEDADAVSVIEINDYDRDAEDGDGDENGEDEEAPVEEVEADECCICRDVVELATQGFLAGVCEHKFHFECIVAWSKVTNLCPLCKKKFNEVTRVDTAGKVVHKEEIGDCKQVFRPDPQDHDIAAQLRLVNEAHCEICGRGDDEHVLLMCEARGCPISNHTYCIGLSEVPSSSWYCTRHASGTRASDFIERPATTVSSRRTTRRLAHLMSNVLSGRSSGTASATRNRRGRGTASGAEEGTRGRARRPAARVTLESDSGRPIRGIAAAYALRMSQELQQIHRRAELMYARGDHNQLSLTTPANRHLVLSRSTVPVSNVDMMWRDFDTSRQELTAAANAPDRRSTDSSPQSAPNSRVSRTLAPEYRELAKLMVDAVGSDNYASTVSLLIPKTAKLRLVSRVKTFFGRLNDREKVVVLDMGCLEVLYKWIQRPQESGSSSSSSSSPHQQVLDAVLTVVEALPIRKSDLIEVPEFQSALDEIANLSDVSVELRERAILTSEKWRNINPPPEPALRPPPTASRPVSRADAAAGNAQVLPLIRAFSAQKQPIRRPKEKSRKQEAWTGPAVEYVKAKLYPLYKQGDGKLPKERFKAIVKQVVELFKPEAAAMQSQIVLPSGELSNITKTRLKTLIDRAYKASSGNTGAAVPASSASNRGTAALTSSYSAVPPSKHRRIT